jgi:peptidoglycan/xylan/chitin deacetylase (PgdA/CDA1 family)
LRADVRPPGSDGAAVSDDRPLVCLTFDDGPTSFRPWTLQVLRVLRVPTVFFEVGVRVRANPRLTRFAAAEGHQVLNHTHTHRALTSLSPDEVRAEVLLAGQAIADAGVTVPFRGVRPPMSAVDDDVRAVLAEIDYREVGGTVSAPDWHPDTTAQRIRDDVLGDLEPWDVIVLHDGAVDTAAGSATAEALPGIVAGVRRRGFEFGLLDDAGNLVPATYVPSRRAVPALQRPVPYRPLLVPDPEPPDPWVSMP